MAGSGTKIPGRAGGAQNCINTLLAIMAWSPFFVRLATIFGRPCEKFSMKYQP
jgi:hypothetical protein